jgi:hypothetical protein
MRGRGLATSGSLAGMCSSTAHDESWRDLNLLASASLGRERQIFTLRRVSATIDSPPRLRARPPTGRCSRSQVASADSGCSAVVDCNQVVRESLRQVNKNVFTLVGISPLCVVTGIALGVT